MLPLTHSFAAAIGCFPLSGVGLAPRCREQRGVGASGGPRAPGPLLVQAHLDLLKRKQPEQERVIPDNPFALIPYCISKQLSCCGGHLLARAGLAHSLALDLLWQQSVIQRSPLGECLVRGWLLFGPAQHPSSRARGVLPQDQGHSPTPVAVPRPHLQSVCTASCSPRFPAACPGVE